MTKDTISIGVGDEPLAPKGAALEEIEARLAAASPGPWHACGTGKPAVIPDEFAMGNMLTPRRHPHGACTCGFVWSVPIDAPILEVTGGPWGDTWAAIRTNDDGVLEAFMDRMDYGEIPRDVQAANMKFIANAPTDIRALLDEITRLKALLQGNEASGSPNTSK